MGALGFFIPAGLVLTLVVALAGQAKAEPKRRNGLPPQPDDAPPPDIDPIPPQGPPPADYEPSYPPQYQEPPYQAPPSMPPGIPPEMLPPGDRPPAVQPGTDVPGQPAQPPVMETPSGPILLKSPFPNVSNRQWSKFVQVMARGEEGTITAGARYGIFLFGVRRLADLGLVTNVKRGEYRGKTVWTGTWRPPYSESAFLTSSQLQYRAFVKSMKEYAGKYLEARKLRPEIFRIKTTPLTLSGFLAFAHVAGFQGAIKSLKERKVRPETLTFVAKANRIF